MNFFLNHFLIGFLFISIHLYAQDYDLKTFQFSLTSEIMESEDLKLKGTISSNFLSTCSSDSLSLKGGVISSALGLYSDPPTLITFFPDTIQSSNSAIARAISTDLNGIQSTNLYVQIGGSKKLIKLPMSAVNDSLYEVSIPESLLTVRNFRTYFESVDSMDYSNTSNYETPLLSIPQNGLNMETRFSFYPDGILSEKWRMFSWPGELLNKRISTASLKEDGYVIHYWNPQTKKRTKPDSLKTGIAYWIHHEFNKPIIFTNSDTTAAALPLDDFTIYLEPGWNMIGSPFSFKTSFSRDNDSISGLYQFGDSQSDGWAGPLDFFEPWAGYAVYNSSEDIDSLVIKPFPDDSVQAERRLSTDWNIALEIQGENYFDRTGRIGRTEKALNEKDGYDIPKLPSMEDFVSISMDIDGNGDFNHSADIRSSDELNGIWNIRLSGKSNSGSIILSGESLDYLPEGSIVSVLDISTRDIIENFLSTGYTIEGNIDGAYDLRFVIGERSFVESTLMDLLSQIPEKFSISQNYPNPFNPETKMDFSVAQTGKVNIIIYNLLGQTVKTLVNETMDYGYHSIVWDGHDELGNPVSSGVYFSELRARGFRQSKKMLLLK